MAIAICGQHTDTVSGASAELRIAQEERIPYFLLEGKRGVRNVKPQAARDSDIIYTWSWDNLQRLIARRR